MLRSSQAAFWESGLTSVHIPASVVKIGEDGFFRSTSLAEVTFAENSQLKEIGYNTFGETAISEIVLPGIEKVESMFSLISKFVLISE